MIVGLQTDVAVQACHDAERRLAYGRAGHPGGRQGPDPQIKKIFTGYRKAHNDAVFDIYTRRIKLARHNKLLTGLPDAYGRGRIIGDYRRVALYGVDTLIKFKQRDKDSVPYRNDFASRREHWARFREEH